MDENAFKAMYNKAMKGSLPDLVTLANIDPANPRYNSQLGRVFDVLHHRMNRPISPIEASEHLMSFRLCLTNLVACDGKNVSASLSKGFTRVWPQIWEIIGSICFPRVKQYTVPTETRQCIRKEIVAMCCLLGHDSTTILKMISTPGFSSFVLEMWSMEVDHPEYHPWDTENGSSIAAFLDQLFVFFSKFDDTDRLEQFLAPMNGDMKSLASTALRHLHHAFYRKRPNFDCVIWSTHIITVLSCDCEPIRNAFLAQHSVQIVTKILVAITADAPSPATSFLKAEAMQYAFWNIFLMIQSTDGVTWVIQALEAKLMFAIVRCEPWLPHQSDNPASFLYPFLNNILPNYSIYRSVLYVIEKSLTKIQQFGLDAGHYQDTPLWNAWNGFVELAESRMNILRSAPGGLLRAHERCHNKTCNQESIRRSEFQQCAACLSAQYCSKSCQTQDWKFGGHREFCKRLEAQRREGYIPEISKGDLEFVGTIIETERVKIQDAFPAIFGAANKKLVVLLLDFSVFPPTKVFIPPESMNFCEDHYPGPLIAKWDHLRKNMDTLPHPTIVFCAQIQRGQSVAPIFRVVTTTLSDDLGAELVLYKGAGCSC